MSANVVGHNPEVVGIVHNALWADSRIIYVIFAIVKITKELQVVLLITDKAFITQRNTNRKHNSLFPYQKTVSQCRVTHQL